MIALTANAMEGDRNLCLAAGMDDYLAKPYTAAQLEATLQRWLPPATTLPPEPEPEPAPAPRRNLRPRPPPCRNPTTPSTGGCSNLPGARPGGRLGFRPAAAGYTWTAPPP